MNGSSNGRESRRLEPRVDAMKRYSCIYASHFRFYGIYVVFIGNKVLYSCLVFLVVIVYVVGIILLPLFVEYAIWCGDSEIHAMYLTLIYC